MIRSTAAQFNDFIDGFIWQDMKDELDIWLNGVRDGLEDTEADEKDLYRNQGRADAIRYFKSLPLVMRDGLLEDQERDIDDEKENYDE
jgi:hypothetical protein